MSITHPHTWRTLVSLSPCPWDDCIYPDCNEKMGCRVTHRPMGVINSTPETPSQGEYHRELAEKYVLEPYGNNNNQWAYEMCSRIEEKKKREKICGND